MLEGQQNTQVWGPKTVIGIHVGDLRRLESLFMSLTFPPILLLVCSFMTPSTVVSKFKIVVSFVVAVWRRCDSALVSRPLVQDGRKGLGFRSRLGAYDVTRCF